MSLERLAEHLGLPVARLLRLDNRPLVFAFLDDTYEAHTLRDRTTGELLRVVTTATGDLVDRADLAHRSNELLAEHSHRMGPGLERLLARHADVPRVRVRIRHGGAGSDSAVDGRSSAVRELSGREIQDLIRTGHVERVELIEDVEIPDDRVTAPEDDPVADRRPGQSSSPSAGKTPYHHEP